MREGAREILRHSAAPGENWKRAKAQGRCRRLLVLCFSATRRWLPKAAPCGEVVGL